MQIWVAQNSKIMDISENGEPDLELGNKQRLEHFKEQIQTLLDCYKWSIVGDPDEISQAKVTRE